MMVYLGVTKQDDVDDVLEVTFVHTHNTYIFVAIVQYGLCCKSDIGLDWTSCSVAF